MNMVVNEVISETGKPRSQSSAKIKGKEGKPQEQAEKPTEKDALRSYQRAKELGNQATVAFASARDTTDRSNFLALKQREQFLWERALIQLAAIPPDSALFARASAKKAQYRQLLQNTKHHLVDAHTDFLSGIIEAANLDPAGVHVTVCLVDRGDRRLGDRRLDNRRLGDRPCLSHLGEESLASAASLIKVPIALALLQKTLSGQPLAKTVATQSNPLDEKIFIDPGNFTENAAGAVMDIGTEYPLRQVMGHMISESDNIATNQLIDHLGYDSIKQALNELGYDQTLVGHKLAGDQVMAENFGSGINQTSTDDITAMMVQIYSAQIPESQEIVAALKKQADTELGYEALKGAGSDIEWLGEKTGQNNRVLASTLAMKVDSQVYILTVGLDYSGDAYALRTIIRDVAHHISKLGFRT